MFAKALKSDPEFIGLVAEMKQDIMTASFNTQPHETKTREGLFYQHHAVEALLARIDAYAEHAEAILEGQDAEAAAQHESD